MIRWPHPAERAAPDIARRLAEAALAAAAAADGVPTDIFRFGVAEAEPFSDVFPPKRG